MKRSTKERLLGLLIVVPVLIILIIGCSVKSEAQQEIDNSTIGTAIVKGPIEFEVGNSDIKTYTVIVDGCQYLVFKEWLHGYISVIHKGNCYNSIHYDTPKSLNP